MLGQKNSDGRKKPRRATFVWTVVACASLAAALGASVDREGRTRLAALLRSEPPPVQMTDASPEIGGTAAEIARLKNETRLLALEKKALTIRLAMVAEGRTGVTGSIEGARPIGRDLPPHTDPEAVEVKITDLPADGEFVEAQPTTDPSVLVSEVAGIPAPVRQAGPTAGKFSVEIGTASSIEEARSIWAELQESAPEASSGLVPLVAMDERNLNRLWVMAGRFPDEESAAERCAQLDGSGAPCSVTSREGRPLPLP